MPTGGGARRARRAERGFTLLELLAVVAIFALVASIALPNLGLAGGRAAEEEAGRLAALLELARQRAVATGTPHRLVVDLDRHGYWLEQETDAPGREGPELDVYAPGPDEPLALAPPRGAGRRFEPVPTTGGRLELLPEEVSFDGVETGGLRLDEGRVELAFARDGTTDAAEIVLADDGGPAWRLGVAPLLDTVRLRRAR